MLSEHLSNICTFLTIFIPKYWKWERSSFFYKVWSASRFFLSGRTRFQVFFLSGLIRFQVFFSIRSDPLPDFFNQVGSASRFFMFVFFHNDPIFISPWPWVLNDGWFKYPLNTCKFLILAIFYHAKKNSWKVYKMFTI